MIFRINGSIDEKMKTHLEQTNKNQTDFIIWGRASTSPHTLSSPTHRNVSHTMQTAGPFISLKS